MARHWWHKLVNPMIKGPAPTRGRGGRRPAANRPPGLERLEDRTLLATAGALDTTFGEAGKALTAFPGFAITQAYALAVQPDGKIVVAGFASVSSGGEDFAVARYLEDGRLDAAFDGDGMLTTDFGANDRARAVALQADGKIVVAGWSSAGDDFAVARYLPDGQLDPSFDGDGRLTTDFGAVDAAYALMLQADGQIVVAGNSGNFINSNFALARYLADGRLDAAFDGDGRLTTDFGAAESAHALALQPDGKIVAAGEIRSGAFASSFALARYLADGQLDAAFDGDGRLTTTFGSSDSAYALALQPDGKIVVAGSVSTLSNPDFALARYLADGQLDAGFDGDGKLTTDFGGAESAHALALQPDGKIVAAGTTFSDFALARYLADGQLDAGFDGDGKLTTDFGGADSAYALAPLAGDRLVAVGSSGSDKFALARYHTNQGGSMQFDAATYAASEAAGSVTITVTRTSGSEGIVRVRYATAAGTAQAGQDYTAATGLLTFANGETSKTFTVAITDDNLLKVGRAFKIRLSDPAGGAGLGALAEASITIRDNDIPEVPDGPRPANLGQVALAFAKSFEQYTNLVLRAYERFVKRSPDEAGLRGWTDLMLAGTVTEERLEAGFLGSPEYITQNGGRGRGWVEGMYRDLLGRGPAESEVQAWLERLAAGAGEAEVAYGFAASVEREGQRVQANYRNFLGRDGTPLEVAAHVELFVRGIATNQDIIATFVGAPEYYASAERGRGNRAVWLVYAYEQVLFRGPSLAEVNAWLTILQ